ncbi:hypothetical protein [Fuchsiella alkaliacetigena]|uniref:hypothetical protein n=1 Tax=Fuchsiella alkaliacetigena TaxID=957042 RepID=UPI002009FA6A|nr:hypothetical protein [Fuchsiella alkaliacetigena]MCK8824734.1 hypothetical protein [Fuchsiella alkaliacetigena]
MSMREETIRVEDGERFVEAKKYLSLINRRSYQRLGQPEKLKIKKGQEMETNIDKSPESDKVLWILKKQVTDWSCEEEVNDGNIEQNIEVADLLMDLADEIIEANDLGQLEEETKVVRCPECQVKYDLEEDMVVETKN